MGKGVPADDPVAYADLFVFDYASDPLLQPGWNRAVAEAKKAPAGQAGVILQRFLDDHGYLTSPVLVKAALARPLPDEVRPDAEAMRLAVDVAGTGARRVDLIAAVADCFADDEVDAAPLESFLARNKYATEPGRLSLALGAVIGPGLDTWLGNYTRAVLSKDDETAEGPELAVDRPDELRGSTVRFGGAELVKHTFIAKTAELSWKDDYNDTAGTVAFSGVSMSHPEEWQVHGKLTLPARKYGLTGEVAYSAWLGGADDAYATTSTTGDSSEVTWAAVASAIAASLSALTSLLTVMHTYRKPIRTRVLRMSKRAKDVKSDTERPEWRADHAPLNPADREFISLAERLLQLSEAEKQTDAGADLYEQMRQNRAKRSGERQDEVNQNRQDADDDLNEIEETWL
ncbi:hypothetical protein TL08_18645 [Actinoalloteichus hymeniacidonis]|uniref:Uncharacterized protein n=1 Tax=Actinoalloteichus hymeniacidonis TaxID=340345 RepID=A0AAC9HSH3_9PSEU|nr:hypothetical protein TL08_18645 [Actinoalloteichus hymeniacidonis]